MMQAAELKLFSIIVRAPLQILDLKIPDPVFFFSKKTGIDQQKDFILLTILRNFEGS